MVPALHPTELILVPGVALSPFILKVPFRVGAGSASSLLGHFSDVSFSLWVSEAPSGIVYLSRVLYPVDFPCCLDVAALWVSTSQCKKARGAQVLAG